MSMFDGGLFSGLFDFDGDGKTDLSEQFLAYKIFEECTKDEEVEEDDLFSDEDDLFSDEDDLFSDEDDLFSDEDDASSDEDDFFPDEDI